MWYKISSGLDENGHRTKNEQFTVSPHMTKTSIKKVIFGLWPIMKVEKKQNSILHVLIYFS